MKKLLTKIILASFVLTLAVTLQAAITNVYEWNPTLSALSIQPQSDDLTQRSGSANYIVKGGMHDSAFLLSSLFNSDADGSYGPNSAGIFIDDISPANDTIIHCDFAESQTVYEIHVFTQWGDMRLFSWFEVWSSTTGTNDGDYSYLGTATFGEIGDDATQYLNSNCVARLYDSDDGILAENVTSIKLIQKNCGYDGYKQPPGTNVPGANIDSCACQELDIIGPAEETTITNEFFWNDDLASLPIQPLSDDLAQGTDATNIIIAGGMHTALSSNYFKYLFNSPTDGELGIGSPDTPGGSEVLMTDAAIPSTLTMEMNCDFVTTTKTIKAIHVFSRAGDARLFTYGEVYSSADGNTYDYIGAVSFGDWGDSVGPYSNKHCVAKLYNSDTNKSLAENIISLKIIFRGVMDTTWVDYVHKLQGSSGGSAIGEIDIIGIDGNIPPPQPPPPTGTNTIYVGKYGTSNGSNYFTVIQDAVDAAADGGLIIVSNGVYDTGGKSGEDGVSAITNRVLCDKAIIIRSVDGPDSTFIVGAPDAGTGENGPGAVRCVCFPWNSGATISGFTLTNGYTLTTGDANREKGGGGARIRLAGLITNCVIVGNNANGYGGGINLQWGTVADCKIYNNYSDARAGAIFNQGGNIYNSTINGNEANDNGGGIMFYSVGGEGGNIYDSTISGNISGQKGGGIYLVSSPGQEVGKVFGCTVASNTAVVWGGGVNIEFGGEVHRAKIHDNESQNHSGGGIYLYRAGKVYDSLIYKNQSMSHGGGIFFDNVNDAAVNGGEVYNCTIVGNSTIGHGGGINMANSPSNYFGKIVNSIIFTNFAFTANPNWAKGPNGTSPFNCSTGPIGGLGGDGNISNNPEFVSIEDDNWRLLMTSPCINAGTNGEVTSTIDLDGNPRIEEGTVDMGCYEYIPEPTIFVLLTILGLAFFLKK